MLKITSSLLKTIYKQMSCYLNDSNFIPGFEPAHAELDVLEVEAMRELTLEGLMTGRYGWESGLP